MSRCHGSKISGSQHNRVPANMVGKHEKKAVTKQDAGTTHQQNDQTSHCGAHVLTESTRESSISALITRSSVIYLITEGRKRNCLKCPVCLFFVSVNVKH